jgi:putative FmdB family regulatory protein
MVLYDYICKKCHKKFREMLTIKEHETGKLKCPKCKSQDLEHVIEPFYAKTSSKTGGW